MSSPVDSLRKRREAVVREHIPGGDGIVCERVYFDAATILAQLAPGPAVG